jgi:hypothetical protein
VCQSGGIAPHLSRLVTVLRSVHITRARARARARVTRYARK